MADNTQDADPVTDNTQDDEHAEELNIQSTPCIRKSTRQVKEPIWMKDYDVKKKGTTSLYPIANISYEKTSKKYQ